MAIESFADQEFRDEVHALHQRLNIFRAEHGFGRAISAPQVGIAKRFIAVNLNEQRHTLVNPVITWHSKETFTMWDDCMSFPSLLVRVARHESISLEALDESGAKVCWERCARDVSELLQHEIDHLDGILAIDRALDRDSIVERKMFDSMFEFFAAKVDYVITPGSKRTGVLKKG